MLTAAIPQGGSIRSEFPSMKMRLAIQAGEQKTPGLFV
jgi:hypothetical protein